MKEIMAWQGSNNEKKQQILIRAEQRRKQKPTFSPFQ